MYDLHAHILPGVDDGAKSPEDTVEMARVAAEHGTKVVLATPHRRDVTQRGSVAHIQELVDAMNLRIQKEGIDLTLLLGMENHLDVDLPEEISKGRALPINGSRYILVEAPFFGRPNYLEGVLFQLQVQGLVASAGPPGAHRSLPERARAAGQPGRAGDAQPNYGRKRRGTLWRPSSPRHQSLAAERAGARHRFRYPLSGGPRSPKLPPGLEAAADIVGPEKARAMVVDIPKAVLEDLPVEIEPSGDLGPSRRWWHFWKSG